ncbi:Holliday junction resolvase RuvX [Demequina sp. TTPB684]|uniref:Holliday junction resolvase RuvX n=1 Tax=unclassified Demequina TaxID=2620311 RepID=UPI001CF2909A|nr:Holliday junction resolvase RuvX [Demequina sp. TMPB413]MCB2414059.1 Holliday junction resolvase RuvX [Demequina sp. TTPB684]UPU89230.1 Holliday junction resolvase RuvX [Demequina sp. TMPB413]
MARGVRIGVDVGTVRVGVAASDPDGIMAFPVETVPRAADAAARVAAIAIEREAIEVYVGLPRHLSGAEGTSAADARAFAEQLAERLEAPVRLVDERLSTTSASRAMREAGVNAKSQRSTIDQAAAVVILDTVLDAAKRGNLGTVATTVAREENHD